MLTFEFQSMLRDSDYKEKKYKMMYVPFSCFILNILLFAFSWTEISAGEVILQLVREILLRLR